MSDERPFDTSPATFERRTPSLCRSRADWWRSQPASPERDAQITAWQLEEARADRFYPGL